jgi:hypothetical protein
VEATARSILIPPCTYSRSERDLPFLFFVAQLVYHTHASSVPFRAASFFRVLWPSLALTFALMQLVQMPLSRKTAQKEISS